MNKQRILSLFGVALLVAGAVLGWKFYDSTYAGSEQDKVLQAKAADIEQQWERNTPEEVKEKKALKERKSFKSGDTIGIITIPEFGKEWKVPIIEGTSDAPLEKGIGHYSDSALPGELGNFALAGHRSGDPQPFRNLLELEKGDEIIVETKVAVYTYVVTKDANQTTLQAEDGGWVIHSPEIEGFEDKNAITLTTCTRLYESDDRSVLFGELKHRKLKSE